MAKKSKKVEDVELPIDAQPPVSEEAAQEIKEHMEKQLSPAEQAEMLRNYVASMEKTVGHSDEDVYNILDAVYRRFLLVLNYSALSKEEGMKGIKAELKKVFENEKERYTGKKEDV
jgi:SepF-like predicted cell division protein (DUF552 family)